LEKYRNKWLKFMIVATGVFMSTLDSSMVNIALPVIMSAFRSPLAATQWVVLVYLLTITSTLLFWGHLADRFGRGPLYGAGMFLFAVGSLACAFSPTLAILILSRFWQALGASMMMAIGPAIIQESFPREQLGRTLGMVGVAVSLGLMSGPSLGGLLLEFFPWRTLFFITVPIGLIFSFMAAKFLTLDRPVAARTVIDWPGALTWAMTLCMITIALTMTTSGSRPLSTVFVVILAAVAPLLMFVRIEQRKTHPLLPLDLFRQKFLSLGIISAVLSFTTLFAAIMLTPFYLVRLQGLPPSMTGLIMMSIPVSIMLTSPLAGWLSDHLERRIIASSGLLLACCGIFLLAFLPADASAVSIACRLVLLGCGQAMFLSPNSAAVLSSVDPSRAGSASALLATARNLGMLLGIAQATLVYSLVFARLTGGLDMKDFQPEYTSHFMVAFKYALLVATATGLAGVLSSWYRGKQQEKVLAD